MHDLVYHLFKIRDLHCTKRYARTSSISCIIGEAAMEVAYKKLQESRYARTSFYFMHNLNKDLQCTKRYARTSFYLTHN